MRFYKNLIGIYLNVLICFSYGLFIGEIPDHIYVREEEDLSGRYLGALQLSDPADWQETFYDASSGDTEEGYLVTCKLFGLIPIKEIEVSIVPEQTVYASGHIIGIYGQTSGVLVLGTGSVEGVDGLMHDPSENRLSSGDYILAVNDSVISTKEELVEKINEYGADSIALTVNRKGEYIRVLVDAIQAKSGAYMLGIWVKDDMAGIGTMTYYSADGQFGALGHGIGDGETGQLLSISQGSIYRTKLLGVTKGVKGTPGELEGLIYYGSLNRIGSIEGNDSLGIYGTLEQDDFLSFCTSDACYSIGYKQEIEKGTAYLLSDVNGEVEAYEIEITEIDYQAKDSNKGIRFTVTDETLLQLTGGIVQGMSGSPIIQNGKLIGAVTHVLVNDPAKGYGIFIENMLEH
jgi:stage IV sporulation protein B